jgi:hypothetical protein
LVRYSTARDYKKQSEGGRKSEQTRSVFFALALTLALNYTHPLSGIKPTKAVMFDFEKLGASILGYSPVTSLVIIAPPLNPER